MTKVTWLTLLSVTGSPLAGRFDGGAVVRVIWCPGLGRAERRRVDAAGAGPADLVRPDQAAGLEHVNVLGDRPATWLSIDLSMSAVTDNSQVRTSVSGP